MASAERIRNPDEESLEQQRYAVLEQIYLLTGSGCTRRVRLDELETQLGIGAEAKVPLLQDLAEVGFLEAGADGAYCLTRRAVDYLQRDAWRRRSVRERVR